VFLNDALNDRTEMLFGGNPMDTVRDWQRDGYVGMITPGDVNGDHYSDIVASLANAYDVGIWLGSAHPDTALAYHWPLYMYDWFAVRDLNGDGYDDLCAAWNNRIYVNYGGSQIDTTVDDTLQFAPFNEPDGLFSGGDLNHDGYNDLISLSGSWLTVHFGGQRLDPQPAWTLDAHNPPYNWMPFHTAACLGDVDGDGVDDFMVTAVEGSGYHRGVAVVYGGQRAGASDPRPPVVHQFTIAAYPNPFNASTVLALDIPAFTSSVTLSLYNVIGQRVSEQQVRVTSPQVRLSYPAQDEHGTPLASGLYFLRASTQQFNATTKLVAIR
jgi:hypothetical protein